MPSPPREWEDGRRPIEGGWRHLRGGPHDRRVRDGRPVGGAGCGARVRRRSSSGRCADASCGPALALARSLLRSAAAVVAVVAVLVLVLVLPLVLLLVVVVVLVTAAGRRAGRRPMAAGGLEARELDRVYEAATAELESLWRVEGAQVEHRQAQVVRLDERLVHLGAAAQRHARVLAEAGAGPRPFNFLLDIVARTVPEAKAPSTEPPSAVTAPTPPPPPPPHGAAVALETPLPSPGPALAAGSGPPDAASLRRALVACERSATALWDTVMRTSRARIPEWMDATGLAVLRTELQRRQETLLAERQSMAAQLAQLTREHARLEHALAKMHRVMREWWCYFTDTARGASTPTPGGAVGTPSSSSSSSSNGGGGGGGGNANGSSSVRELQIACAAEMRRSLLRDAVESCIRADGTISLSYKLANELSDGDPDAGPVADVVADLAATGVLSFPWKRYDRANKLDMFAALQNYAQNVSQAPYTIPHARFGSHQLFPITMDGVLHELIATQPGDYERMDVLSDYFNEEQRLRARRADQVRAPLDAWTDRASVERLVRGLLHKQKDITSHALREALYVSTRECVQFKPSFAVALLRRLNASRVLDISAGWGDRLLAAAAANMALYVGVDPNQGLRAGHQAMLDLFAPSGAVRNGRYMVIYAPFETAPLPDGVTYDCVLACPPFHNMEIYADDTTQSTCRYTEMNDWLVRFMFVSLQRAWRCLDVGGNLALQISDVASTNCAEILCLYIQARLPGARYRGVISSAGLASKPRPMWIFAKESASMPSAAQRAETYMAQMYSHIYAMLQRGLDVPSVDVVCDAAVLEDGRCDGDDDDDDSAPQQSAKRAHIA